MRSLLVCLASISSLQAFPITVSPKGPDNVNVVENTINFRNANNDEDAPAGKIIELIDFNNGEFVEGGIPPSYHDLMKPPHGGSSQTHTASSDAILLTALLAVISVFVLLFSFVLWCLIRRKIRMTEDELIRKEENQAYLELNSDEQELYFQSKDYLAQNPFFRGELTLSQNLVIQEKGVAAFEFQKDAMLTNNDLMILNKTELNFFKKFECCCTTNLPIPMKNEVYYFESKIYSLPDPENTKISVGLGIKPYPWFRLPGRHAHSVSYDSDGYRRHNQPFHFDYEPPFPKYMEGDVIGIGYRTRNGTIFFTRNGKKVNDFKIGGHIRNFKPGQTGQLYPIVGANNLCSVHVNLGQGGFVFIEANVKKWGYAPREGTGPAPPAYNKFNSDIILERSEIDEDDLSERDDEFPPDFWEVHNGMESKGDKYSYNAYSEVNSDDERITLNSIIPQRPPSYDEDNRESFQEGEAQRDAETIGTEEEEEEEEVVDQPESEPFLEQPFLDHEDSLECSTIKSSSARESNSGELASSAQESTSGKTQGSAEEVNNDGPGPSQDETPSDT